MTARDFQLEQFVRPNILTLQPYRCAREKYQGGTLLDANENPYPHPYAETLLNRYPDPYQRELCRALADFNGVYPEMILAGSGSDEVLDWIFKVFCDPIRDRVAIPEPTYGMYRVMADIFGVGVFDCRLEGDFGFKAEPFIRSVPDDVKVVFLCSPNNPTGNLLNREDILRLAGDWGKIVVVDEAYIEFSAADSMAQELERHPNIVVMRTFSKAFGRAGLRMGYAIASPAVIDLFRKVKAPYNLNALTQREAVKALIHAETMRRDIWLIVEERHRLEEELSKITEVGKIFPSEANFLLFNIKHATQLCGCLAADGIIVRDRSSVPGLGESIRVTVGTPEENSAFLDRLRFHLQGESK